MPTPSTPTAVKVGRRPVLTDELISEVVKQLNSGVSHKAAAGAVGVSERTSRSWLSQGRELDAKREVDPAHEFTPHQMLMIKYSQEVDRTRYRTEVGLAASIVQATRGGILIERRTITQPNGAVETIERWTAPDWRAALSVLTHTRSNDWSPRVSVSDPDGQPLGVGAIEAAAREQSIAAGAAAFLKQRAAQPAQEQVT